MRSSPNHAHIMFIFSTEDELPPFQEMQSVVFPLISNADSDMGGWLLSVVALGLQHFYISITVLK